MNSRLCLLVLSCNGELLLDICNVCKSPERKMFRIEIIVGSC